MVEGEKGPKCPICGRPVEPRHRPFCSKRCADVDLSRWLTGSYTIAGAAPEEEEDEMPSGPPPAKPEKPQE
jgi:endogenous inhibitor of DNA gyrase (YacG/DUF329 family)